MCCLLTLLCSDVCSTRRSPPIHAWHQGCRRGVPRKQEPPPKRWHVPPSWPRSSRRLQHFIWCTVARPAGGPSGVEALRKSPPWPGGVRRRGHGTRETVCLLRLSLSMFLLKHQPYRPSTPSPAGRTSVSPYRKENRVQTPSSPTVHDGGGSYLP